MPVSWVKLDDRFPDHPKMLRLGDDYDACISLHVRALCYCAANLTDGFVPSRVFCGEKRSAGLLMGIGLWESAKGGWQVHDYLEYNPSKEETMARRERISELRSVSGKAGADARWHDGKDGKDDGKPDGNGNGSGHGNEHGPVPGSTNHPEPVPQDPMKPIAQTDPEFERFWGLVPRKVGRGQAVKSYRAARKKASAEDIEAGMIRYAKSVDGKDVKFVAHPATWLNGERWTDEDAKPASAPEPPEQVIWAT